MSLQVEHSYKLTSAFYAIRRSARGLHQWLPETALSALSAWASSGCWLGVGVVDANKGLNLNAICI